MFAVGSKGLVVPVGCNTIQILEKLHNFRRFNLRYGLFTVDALRCYYCLSSDDGCDDSFDERGDGVIVSHDICDYCQKTVSTHGSKCTFSLT